MPGTFDVPLPKFMFNVLISRRDTTDELTGDGVATLTARAAAARS